jgi:beta-lactamase class A
MKRHPIYLCGIGLAWMLLSLLAAGADLPPAARTVIRRFHGKLYLAAKNLRTREVIEYRADEKVQTASVIKLPIMAEVFAQAAEGRLNLQEELTITEENLVRGSGILQDLSPGIRLSIRDLVVLMITMSDNSATNLLMDRVGIRNVNERMRQYGLKNTVLYKKIFKPATEPLPEEQKRWGLGVTTPREMLVLMEKIYRREIVDPASCEAMMAILKKQRDRDQIPRYFVGSRWSKVEVANKTGALNQVRNDVGIVFTPQGDCVLSLFAQESQDEKWTADNEATLTLGRLAEALVTAFRRK